MLLALFPSFLRVPWWYDREDRMVVVACGGPETVQTEEHGLHLFALKLHRERKSPSPLHKRWRQMSPAGTVALTFRVDSRDLPLPLFRSEQLIGTTTARGPGMQIVEREGER